MDHQHYKQKQELFKELRLNTTVMLRKNQSECILTSGAALFIALSRINFFFFTQPVNQETLNWTVMPENWEALRNHWEISHVIGALLTFVSCMLLTISLVVRRTGEH